MISPYVRRLRFGAELRTLRKQRGLTIDALAGLVHQSRVTLNRLEIGQRRPDLAEVMTILDAFGTTGPDRDALITLARDAAIKGWWHPYGNSISPHEQLAADLESGADIIQEYAPAGVPDLLQTPEFTAAMIDLDRAHGPLPYRPERVTQARKQRQRQLFSQDQPAYDAILDESALLRLDVPDEVMSAQLRHLIHLVTTQPNVSVRVWPNDSRYPNCQLPIFPFQTYIFGNPTDPSPTVVTTATGDQVITNPDKTAHYARTHNHLSNTALSPDETVTHLEILAKRRS